MCVSLPSPSSPPVLEWSVRDGKLDFQCDPTLVSGGEEEARGRSQRQPMYFKGNAFDS